MPITLTQIYRHPVKGLTPESLERTVLWRACGRARLRGTDLAQEAVDLHL